MYNHLYGHNSTKCGRHPTHATQAVTSTSYQTLSFTALVLIWVHAHNFAQKTQTTHVDTDMASLDFGTLNVPIFLRIVLDRPIRTELAHLGRRPDTFLDPFRAIIVFVIDNS